jgi:hypothetical protein
MFSATLSRSIIAVAGLSAFCMPVFPPVGRHTCWKVLEKKSSQCIQEDSASSLSFHPELPARTVSRSSWGGPRGGYCRPAEDDASLVVDAIPRANVCERRARAYNPIEEPGIPLGQMDPFLLAVCISVYEILFQRFIDSHLGGTEIFPTRMPFRSLTNLPG